MDPSGFARFVDPQGKCSDPRLINAVAAYCGAALAGPEDIKHARALCGADFGQRRQRGDAHCADTSPEILLARSRWEREAGGGRR